MTLKILTILPLLATTLGGCTLNAKLLGEPYDSATDGEDDSTSSTSGQSATSNESASSTSSTSSATDPESTSSSSSATATGPDTDASSSSTSSATGPDTDASSSSTTSATGPDTDASSSSTSEAESDTDVSSTSSTSGFETGGGQVCEDPPLDAPGVERACEVDQDCIVVFHMTDCCGTVDAYGISEASAGAYAEAAAPCTFEPFCDCVAEETDAEDGEATADNGSIVAVCLDNVCRSAVP
ncbi:hypothetical protein [Nannocystis bainbridge]|uniref:Uncharacterized protein n=1 Tax=Nannocystis bainbridge TaxID=2995303 RepID=A0ABT5ECM0_9BACT|nr:hypothetical protein [Nannocystis bainbridge]MDC0723606.1 hypothetical protein [Nannocystis bainbridge]